MFNTKKIEFVVGQESDRPKSIRSMPSQADYQKYLDIVIAFICAENQDTESDVERIAAEVVRYASMVGRSVLIVPFAHLSSAIATGPSAGELVEGVCEKVRMAGMLSGCGGFGFHKALIAEWVTMAHEGSVAFRDSKYPVSSISEGLTDA